MWNERFEFNIQVPELAMVRFVVEDYDSTSQNDLIGHYCLPLTSVQSGKNDKLKQHEATKRLEFQMLARISIPECQEH